MNHLVAEPISFIPIYKEKIWGGQALASKLGRPIPDGKLIGESWELCGFGEEQSVVAAGPMAGKTLGNLFLDQKHELAGENVSSDTFPLLVKLIDSRDKLSVQVHPDDNQVKVHGWGEFGKTECWYIVDAAPDAGLILGFRRDVSSKEIEEAIEADKLNDLLNIVKIKSGDIYFVPAGTVHAILGNSLIYEVQQSSDITLRLYDWGRKSRPLHIREAVEIADTHSHTYRIEPVILQSEMIQHSYCVACRYFAIERYFFSAKSQIKLSSKKSFRFLTCTKGAAQIRYPSGNKNISSGESTLIPAELNDIHIIGTENTTILCTTIPDIPNEIIKPLLNNDIPESSILKLGGFAETNDLLPLL